MTVKFQNKFTGEVLTLVNVSLMTPNSSVFGTTGYGLNFFDSTFCVMDKQTFELISVKG